jgi:hypothetical protein
MKKHSQAIEAINSAIWNENARLNTARGNLEHHDKYRDEAKAKIAEHEAKLEELHASLKTLEQNND